MNNCLVCECLHCGRRFVIGVPDLLDVDGSEIIGDLVWCGYCDEHRYECYWGAFHAGNSSDKVDDVLRIWKRWADGYRELWNK